MKHGTGQHLLLAMLMLGLLGGGQSAMAATCGNTGPNASLGGMRAFPSGSPWNQSIAGAAVDPNSTQIIARIGKNDTLRADFGAGTYNGSKIGIPYVVVPEGQAKVPVKFTSYPGESDPGPYPIPASAPIEGGGGDRHVIVVQANCAKPNRMGKLYELYLASPTNGYRSWNAANGAVFDLNSTSLRPAGWTSADAAGLPIFPGLVRYDEAASGAIRHALRVTVQATRKAYVSPARHWASYSTDPYLPPMGARFRLKASFNVSGFPAKVQVILRALQQYGMFVADNGPNWFISGATDDRWSNDELQALKRVTASNLELVKMGTIVK